MMVVARYPRRSAFFAMVKLCFRLGPVKEAADHSQSKQCLFAILHLDDPVTIVVENPPHGSPGEMVKARKLVKYYNDPDVVTKEDALQGYANPDEVLAQLEALALAFGVWEQEVYRLPGSGKRYAKNGTRLSSAQSTLRILYETTINRTTGQAFIGDFSK